MFPIFCCSMEGSNDRSRSTAAEMDKPIQETGDSTLEPSLTVGNENGTHVYSSMANFEELHVGVDETSKVYAEPSQEVGHNKPSVLVTGATVGDPEVKITFAFRIATFIVALVAKE